MLSCLFPIKLISKIILPAPACHFHSNPGKIKPSCLQLLLLFIFLLLNTSCNKNLAIAVPDSLDGGKSQLPEGLNVINVSVRDPSLILANGTYYLFGTGKGIKTWSSTDLITWKVQPAVFAAAPSWTNTNIPGFSNYIWAPEITFYKGQYYLFYSISVFGTNNSAIGFATNKSLDSKAEGYQWIDHGMVTQSNGTSWNAIDPNFVLDFNSAPHLLLGSFFSGIKITALKDNNIVLKADLITKPTLANRDLNINPFNAIEAPFVMKHNQYYYLFASINNCCSGIKSDYKTIVGRSKQIDGQYVDKNGKEMPAGGGTLILAGNDKWHGAGGASVYDFEGKQKIVFFSYDNKGIERLRIGNLQWDASEWPIVNLND
jgi:arabinan endo-1,5-alpha-L-arabinosidase